MHNSNRPRTNAADSAARPAPSVNRQARFIVRSHLGSPGIDSTLAVAAGDADEARSLAERFWRNFYRCSGRSIEPFTVTTVERRPAPIPTWGPTWGPTWDPAWDPARGVIDNPGVAVATA